MVQLIKCESPNLEWMKKMVKQSIQIYNEERPHFSLLMQTPKQTHQEENIQIRNYKKEKSDSLETV